MTDDPIDPNAQGVLPFKLRPDQALANIRRLCSESKNISWSVHTLQRMLERDITDAMAIEVLRKGDVKGDIEAGKNPGEWKVKVVKSIKGRREIGVVVLIMRQARLFVKTVEWEDT